MFKTRITSASLPTIAPKLQRFADAIKDLTPFWRDVFAPKYLADVQENWDQSGAMVGGWPPLAPGYAAWKAARWGRHLGILELSLRLRGSLQWLGSDIGPEGIFRPSPRSVTIGTSVPYAGKHQRGEDGMQRRQMLWARDTDFVAPLWTGWLTERAAAAGFTVTRT